MDPTMTIHHAVDRLRRAAFARMNSLTKVVADKGSLLIVRSYRAHSSLNPLQSNVGIGTHSEIQA